MRTWWSTREGTPTTSSSTLQWPPSPRTARHCRQCSTAGGGGDGRFPYDQAMLVLMNMQATPDQVANVIRHVRERGFEPIELPGIDRLAIGVLGSNPGAIRDAICDLPGGVDGIPVSKPAKQVTREWHPEPTLVDVSGVRFGDGSFAVIAGPCAVESREQVLATARHVAAAGASMFRGGAFKPRSSPYSFRGLGLDGLRHLAEARVETGVRIVTGVLTPADGGVVSEPAEMPQVW